jgi:uncharacterized membrane protein YagU involved in acid resistance
MTARNLVRDSVIGAISGYVGVRVMDLATTKLYEMTPEQVKEQEKKVSPGISYEIAAKDLASRVGMRLSDRQAQRMGNAFHFGLALKAGEMYVLLRQKSSLGAVTCATVTAMVLFLGVDEGLTPMMGWSAPASAYPVATHARGLVGHLVLGATIATTAEFLWWALDP